MVHLPPIPTPHNLRSGLVCRAWEAVTLLVTSFSAIWVIDVTGASPWWAVLAIGWHFAGFKNGREGVRPGLLIRSVVVAFILCLATQQLSGASFQWFWFGFLYSAGGVVLGLLDRYVTAVLYETAFGGITRRAAR